MNQAVAKVPAERFSIPAVVRETAVVAGLAGLMMVSSFVRAPLPFTPVPVTFQTLVVLLGSALAGPRRGMAAQGLYLGLGLAGAPVFAGGVVGMAILAGPTGGYLVGFVLAALAVGNLLGGRPASLPRTTAAIVAGEMIILSCGAAYLVVLGMSPAQALFAGVVPFLLWDGVKTTIAVASYRLLRGPTR